MTEVKIVIQIFNEEIIDLNYLEFVDMIESTITEGFDERNIDMQIKEVHRSDE